MACTLYDVLLSHIADYCAGIFKLEIPKITLESRISSRGVIQADDIPGIIGFLQKCLILDPVRRPTAGDLISHEWLKLGFQVMT